MSRTKTLDQIEAMQRKAVRFVDTVLDDPALAPEIESLSSDQYAERKHIRINPNPKELRYMPGPTKQELQDTVDEVSERITDMLNPALTRIKLISKLQELNELVNGSDEDDDEEEEDSDKEEEN